jgi:type VI secretion system protein ImpG
MDKTFLDQYLAELQALESFRSTHKTSYQNTPLSQGDDPDTRRLIEALAFFSTRAKTSGVKTLLKAHERIFSQYFPSLLSPMPAMNLIEFEPTLRLTESVHLKKGIELLYTSEKGAIATFQTLEERSLSPLKLMRLEQILNADGSTSLHLNFFTSQAVLETLTELTLYMNHMSSFAPSVQALYMLFQHAEEVNASFVDQDAAITEPAACKLSLAPEDEAHLFSSPLNRLRSFLHLPEQQLFFQIHLPPSPKKWQGINIEILLGKQWPKNLKFTANSFLLNIVPCANVIRSEASPIRCHGEKDSYPILPSDPTMKCKLHTAFGAYEVTDTVWDPLRPGILGVLSQSYEVNIREESITLNLKDAAINPKVVIVDALWSQPWFSSLLHEEISVSFARTVSGLKPRLFGSIRPHENLKTKEDPEHLLRLLTLKNQTKLSLEQLLFLLHMLRPLNESHFKGIDEMIQELKVEQPYDHRGISPSIKYLFKIRQSDTHNWCVILLFFRIVHEFLNCWLATFQLETHVAFMNGKTLVTYTGPNQHELPILAPDLF